MKKIYIVSSLILVLSIFFFFSEQIKAQPAAMSVLDGYAWSSNIGWISFSEANSKVEIDSSGNLSGYAWSSNIGWLQFGGLSDFPITDSNAAASNAKIDNGKIVGWAKFLSASGATSGWDGWVLFSGTNHSVNLTGTSFSGYAWGDDVVGWIDFSKVSLINNITCSSDEILVSNICTKISCSASPSNLIIPLGYSAANTTLSSSFTNTSGYTYKWFKGVTPTLISGANGTSYIYSVATSTNLSYPNNNMWSIPFIVNISNGTQSATSSECFVSATDTNVTPPVITPPNITKFDFNPDTVPQGESCALFLTAENVSSCKLTNRLGNDSWGPFTATNQKIQISDGTAKVQIGAHTLQCKATSTSPYIKYNTQKCFSESDTKEN